MQITTGTVSQYTIEGQVLQSVPWQITEDEVVLLEGSQSFPLEATADDVRAFLEKTLEVYQEDAARFAAVQEQQAAQDAAAEVASEISNITITA